MIDLLKNLPKQPVTMTIDGAEIELKYQDELVFDEETINSDLKDQPSFFAWYAVLHEKANKALSVLKMTLDILNASLASDIRKAAFLGAEKKPTEKYIEEQIMMTESYQEAQIKVFEAQKNLGILRGIKDAFIHRKDMLVTLGANMRVQMDADIYVKRQEIEGTDIKK